MYILLSAFSICRVGSGNSVHGWWLQDAHRQRIVDWCDAADGCVAAFDFTTKGVLQEAVAKGEYWRLRDSAGRPPGMIGWWPSRAVTFVDNHDTGSTQAHWPFPQQSLHQARLPPPQFSVTLQIVDLVARFPPNASTRGVCDRSDRCIMSLRDRHIVLMPWQQPFSFLCSVGAPSD